MVSSSSPTVLLAEDNATHRAIMRGYLERHELKILEASDGQSALDLILTSKPSLVVLDSTLPVRSGLECLSWIRNTPETATIPVIMCTARTEDSFKKSCSNAGCSAFISKPVLEKHFSAVVMATLNGEPPPPTPEGEMGSEEGVAKPGSEVGLAVGEYAEEAGGEDVPISTGGGETCTPLKGSHELTDLLQSRLGIFKELDRLEARRGQLQSSPALSEGMQSEVRRQKYECQFLPKAESARSAMEARKNLLAELKAKIRDGEADAPAKEVLETLRVAFTWRRKSLSTRSLHSTELPVMTSLAWPSVHACWNPS
ncbi:MAG: response regulator [Planctomycetota bacterium]|jgi:CheY-like chemotaxis protein